MLRTWRPLTAEQCPGTLTAQLHCHAGPPAALTSALVSLQPSEDDTWDPGLRRGAGRWMSTSGALTQGNAHLPSRSEGTVSCMKASEPQGNRAFTAHQSRPHSTSRLRDSVICLHVRFLAPGECESFRQFPCLTLSGSFTTFSARLSQERRRGLRSGFKSVAGGMIWGKGRSAEL